MSGARRDQALTACVAIVVYAVVLGNGFVYDDLPQILENPWLRSVRHVPDILTNHVWGFSPLHDPLYYRPAMHLVNLAVYQMAGPRPWVFHATGLLVHAAVAVVAFRLVLGLLGGAQAPGARRGALIGGLMFAAHPVNAEAVAWAGVLPDQLCALFSLLCLGSHARAMSSGRWAHLRSLPWLLAALLSKETALTVPALLAVMETLRPGSGGVRGAVRRLWPSLVLVAVFLGLRAALLGGLVPAGALPQARGPASLALGTFSALLHYAGKLVFPWPLSFVYELRPLSGALDVLAAPGAWLLAGWVAAAVVMRGRDRVPALALALFLAPLAPALYGSLVMVPPLADRYLYLPFSGFALFLGWLGATPAGGRAWAAPVGRILFAVLLLAAGAGGALRAVDFRSNLTLWSDAAAKAPASSLARGRLATALFAAGKYEDGVREAREAIRLDPRDPDHHYNLALASERRALWGVAAEGYRNAIALGNDDAEVHTRLASVLLREGDATAAAAHAERATTIAPAYAEARYVLGRALVNLGDYRRGAAELAVAARLRPEAESWRRDAELAAGMAAPPALPQPGR